MEGPDFKGAAAGHGHAMPPLRKSEPASLTMEAIEATKNTANWRSRAIHLTTAVRCHSGHFWVTRTHTLPWWPRTRSPRHNVYLLPCGRWRATLSLLMCADTNGGGDGARRARSLNKQRWRRPPSLHPTDRPTLCLRKSAGL